MFRKNRKGWIGVDIGTSAIKLAQVVCVDGQVRVSQTAVIGRRLPWLDEQAGLECTPLGSKPEIQAAFQCGGAFTGRRAVAALPMHVYDLRGIHLPAGSIAERRTMILSELAERWSFSDGGSEYDYWETDLPGVTTRHDEANVSVVAIPKGWAQQAARDVSQAGLECVLIDGPPIALARAVAPIQPLRRVERLAVVDWGFSSTTFCVIADSRPVYIRRIRGCGLRMVLEALQQSLGVTADQAQYLLDTCGLPDPEGAGTDRRALSGAIADGAVEPLRSLVHELNRTLAFFHTQRRALVPTKIVLTGGGAAIRNADHFLGQQLGLPVATWELPGLQGSDDEKNNARVSLLFASAVGLSILAVAA